MPNNRGRSLEETVPLTKDEPNSRSSMDSLASSVSSASTTSLILERLNEQLPSAKVEGRYKDEEQDASPSPREPLDIEDGKKYYPGGARPEDMRARRALWIMGLICLAGWLLALGLFLVRGDYKHVSTRPHDPMATASRGSGKRVTLESVMSGQWRPRKQGISWIAGPEGEDGLLLERSVPGKPFLVVEDVQNLGKTTLSEKARVLMKKQGFMVGDKFIGPDDLWPSPDLKKVLIRSATIKNWRHSSTGLFWIFDVETQTGEPLDPSNPNTHVQLAQWSPKSDAIAFTRDNNVYLRKLDFSKTTVQITKDGGPELFYGVPDWVYEEEVFSGSSATWWSDTGNYLAFLRTNESEVPTFPVQYFITRPTGIDPKPGEEAYPYVRDIKYPKAGAPNPTVNIQFYDVDKMDVFSVDISDDFEDDTRLITEVVWAGSTDKILVRETNRESDLLKMILIDVESRSGKTVRELDVAGLDGGWMEVSQDTTYIPSDPPNGREHDGYIDTVIHEGFDHLGYFTPLDNPKPVLLTKGEWEVVNAPSGIDLKNNLVYFVATKEGSTQRHVYNTKLDGTSISSITDTQTEAYYGVSFSTGAGYALLSYDGPSIPWQKLINTPSNPTNFSLQIEDNADLEQLARRHSLPIESYSTVDIGNGVSVNVLERLPPHFDKKRRYPVLVQQYSGPGSQSVDKRFNIDFQSYIASSLNYIVLTVDPRGTGFRGRDFRCVTRGNLGVIEATDHIALAKVWGQKNYVDESRMAIWGWSYGGFETLKTLELDGGETFQYGMAVAPVTDWRFYDSIYTERYMHTPQNNNAGYNNASVHDVARLGENVRFLVMHGIADDNVHTQNTYTLLDHLDVGGVENYDVHVFPDSDHGIYFHNANRIVYDKLSSWLVNAFNGEWLRVDSPVPKGPSDDK